MSLFAQNKYFEKTLPLWATAHDINSIISLPDSSFVIAGNYTGYPDVKWFPYIAKIDNSASLEWQTLFNTEGESGIFDIIQGNYGHYASAGTIAQDYIGNSQSGMCSYFVNESGYLQSLSNYGQPESDSRAYRIIQTPDGGYMSVGYLINGGYPYYTLYLVKLNADGSKQWQRIYDDFFNYYCTFRDVMNAPDGGYYLVGSVDMNWDPNPNLGNILLMKIDAVGNTIWTKIHNVGEMDQGLSFARTTDNGFMICGGSALPGGQKMKPYLMKTDSLGNFIWDRRYFVVNFGEGGILGSKELENGLFCVGYYYSGANNNIDIFLLRTDLLGEPLWYRTYGNSVNSYGGYAHDYAYDFTPTLDGGYMIVGRKDSMLSATEGYAYAWLVKTNCMGLLTVPKAAFTATPISANIYEFTNQSQYVYPDSIDGGHYIWNFGDGSPPYICGQGYEPCSANAIPHTYQAEGVYGVTLQAIVCNDTSVAVQSVCLGVEPNPQAAFTYTDFGGIIQFTNLSQNAYLTQGGYYTWNFGDGSPPVYEENPFHTYPENGSYTVSLTLVVCQDTSVFTQEITAQTVGILPPDPVTPLPPKGGNTILVYPNPAQNTLTFAINNVLKSPSGDLGVRLLTLTGQTVLQTTLAAGETSKTISVAQLPVGLYLYIVSGDTDNGNNGGNGGNGGVTVLARGKVAVMR